MKDPISRRDFVRQSMGWTVLVATGCATNERGTEGAATGSPPHPADPIDDAPDFANAVRQDGGLPFHKSFTGDDFRRAHKWLIDPETALSALPGGKLPEPTERVPLVVVGGGLGGLASAWLLKDLSPVLLEQAPRFGGNAKGERWRASTYGIGAAYYIQPDEGDDIDRIYEQIGIKGKARKLEVPDPVEYRGTVFSKFWTGEASPADAAKFQKFVERMHHYAKDEYPDIPIEDEKNREAVAALDKRSLRDVVTEWLDGSVPEALRAALQNYCYSSMGAGWQEVSAAGAINFLAGEEFGVLALPGGNGAMTRAFWQALRRDLPEDRLRTGCFVFRVQDTKDGVLVAYEDPAGTVRTLLARAAVLACPKYVVKQIVPTMEPDREKAIAALRWRAYMVVNVLVRRGLAEDFYDMYLLRDGAVLESGSVPTRATDVILGNWARVPGLSDQSVLTLYWPFPYDSGRADILFRPGGAFQALSAQVEVQVREVLALLKLAPDDVEQVRMTRFGHAVPVSAVGFIAAGHADVLRRPIGGRIFFVNQDNWALPAVETCLTEAIAFAPQVRAALGS